MGVTEMDRSTAGRARAAQPEADCALTCGSGQTIRLLIVDHTPTRLGIRMALGGEVEVCAEAGDVETAIRCAKREQPDLALIGTGIADDWRRGIRGIRRAAPGCEVVVLAQSEDPDELLESVRGGAVGYVSGGLEAETLRRIIRATTHNEAIIPRALVGELLRELRSGADAGGTLTAREAQVLAMLRRGHSTAAMAERLQIAPVTVRRHVSELVRKLGVESRADLTKGAGQDRR